MTFVRLGYKLLYDKFKEVVSLKSGAAGAALVAPIPTALDIDPNSDQVLLWMEKRMEQVFRVQERVGLLPPALELLVGLS